MPDPLQDVFDLLNTVEDMVQLGRGMRGPPDSPGVGSAEFVAGYDKGGDDMLNSIRLMLRVRSDSNAS